MSMITYETARAATGGDVLALEEVLAHLDGYIDRLCTQPYVDDAERVTYGVDSQRKTYLQGKLLAAILRYDIDG